MKDSGTIDLRGLNISAIDYRAICPGDTLKITDKETTFWRVLSRRGFLIKVERTKESK